MTRPDGKLKVFMTSSNPETVGVTDHHIKTYYKIDGCQVSDDKSVCAVKLSNTVGHRVLLQFQMASPHPEAAEHWHRAFSKFLSNFGMTKLDDTDELVGKGLSLHGIEPNAPISVLTRLMDVEWAVSPT